MPPSEFKANDFQNVVQYPGETCAIRPVNTADPGEMSRLAQLDRDWTRIRWFESVPDKYAPLDPEELDEFARDNSNHLLFVVSGTKKVTVTEKGKMQGWVKINADSEFRVKQIKENRLIGTPGRGKLDILEISFARLANAAAGQMASGVRQVCAEIMKNLLSDKRQVVIVAYVMPGNENSLHLLLASAFEEKGRVQYGPDACEKDHFFVLNWKKLAEKLQSSTF